MTSFLQFTDTDCYRPSRVDLVEQAGKKLTGDKKNKENDVEFYYEMQQAREKDKERLKNDKTFWEFVKEGEDAMQIPEKRKDCCKLLRTTRRFQPRYSCQKRFREE